LLPYNRSSFSRPRQEWPVTKTRQAFPFDAPSLASFWFNLKH